MTDAEATVRQSILSAMAETWRKQPEEMLEAVMKSLFKPSTVWAVADYLAEKRKENRE